ncbi:MAG: peptidoglycan DD-metalloendopeptidase family protein [bacterium]|nr:peptidoglycan DD-metalloendopeptidase family protein [bacterium]
MIRPLHGIWLLVVLLVLVTSGLFVSSKFANSYEDLPVGESAQEQANRRLDEIRKQITETESLLSSTRQKKATLQNEIIYQDSQIKLTELKIAETQEEIDSLTNQIDRLEGVLSGLSEVFAERAVETYKVKRLGDPFVLLVTADSVSQFISRFHYLRKIQEHDRDLLLQMQVSQTNYEDQRVKVESLQTRLETQKLTLSKQKTQKQNLLTTTKNDEKKYQALLAELRADADSIARALAAVGAKIGNVSKGDVIASVGNTGCSTGPHLHFEAFENARVEGGKVVGDRINPNKYLDNGQFQHPLPNSIVTNGYGVSYLLGVHTGIDFAYPWSQGPTAGSPIYAADKGVAYAASDSQACYLTGTVGKGIIVDHQNGLVTLYWHIP